ncbi:4-diphosphocytidyl-2-C-methyl-D-erythritol kinase [Beijerinckiaceae bacterium RH AL1]|nr:4-diphosphocytidyl-2-C-methyl-D-erythritol kinase [Beijerinckiaceae bacterium RH AL8]VVB43339.1 4-diphosphocytidyl-2-C-methyl-D-erythritol kinase [Beijerinckiaceae bacterium RH CH11]VVC53783.1 4-diphosphocytidyl-2-C-methyl-D-erythritol kinase [Beijerinckiaceae bacterium RH AL1]
MTAATPAGDGRLVERAPAKINLTLHVVARREDGYHALESLVVFTRSGDTLTLVPGEALTLTIEGPTAAASGDIEKNLVIRAARALARRVDGLELGAFHLVKRLPVAAGIGGGSSDAAAALRLLARHNGLALDDARIMAAAAETGADIPVCLAASARMMRGIGDELGPVLKLPPLPALIVNPGVPLETRAVFTRMDLPPGWRTTASAHPAFADGTAADAVFTALRRGRNDLEDPACVLAPVVSDVLAVLGAAPGCKLARMSGSGATCFGLFADCRAAARAKKAIQRVHPGWWVKTTMLG